MVALGFIYLLTLIYAPRYHRIISRIRNQLPPNQQDIVRHTLEWIGCATSPLTKEEILQALAITPGEMNFAKGRKVFADILELCGPIIEIENGVLQFVHFTAKEYIHAFLYCYKFAAHNW